MWRIVGELLDQLERGFNLVCLILLVLSLCDLIGLAWYEVLAVWSLKFIPFLAFLLWEGIRSRRDLAWVKNLEHEHDDDDDDDGG